MGDPKQVTIERGREANFGKIPVKMVHLIPSNFY